MQQWLFKDIDGAARAADGELSMWQKDNADKKKKQTRESEHVSGDVLLWIKIDFLHNSQELSWKAL